MNNSIVAGKILSLQYENSRWQGSQGVKGGNRSYKNGEYYVKVNHGYATKFKPSRLTAFVEVDGNTYEVWVDFYFKNAWGRLTESRLDALERTCPEYLDLVDCGTYFKADEASLAAWLTDAQAAC